VNEIMKFTLGNLPTLGWDKPVKKLVEIAQLAEELGYDRFGISDWRFYQDCIVVMAACASGTQKIEIESLVTDPFVRHPALTACAFATIDDLSEGRAILGISSGSEETYFVGQDRSKPLTAVREAVEVIRRMWAGETVTFEGECIRIQGAKLNFQSRKNIPILIAAKRPRMLELAGELADIVHLATWFINAGHYQDHIERVRVGAQRAGRDLSRMEIDLSIAVCVSEDGEAAREGAKRPAAIGLLWTAGADERSKVRGWNRPPQFNVPEAVIDAVSKWDFWKVGETLPDELARLITPDILNQFAVAGTPRECAQQLREIRKYAPFTGIRTYTVPPKGRPIYEGWIETINGFGQVIAELRDSM
jgi:5,10-methylenetetrahydromethanopterin reductase